MREVAHRSGLVDGENSGQDQNPAGSHALRESFSSILINNGAPDSVTNFWWVHSTEMSDAYKGSRLNELREMYRQKERFISIEDPSESEAIESIKKELESKTRDIELDNKDLKPRVR